MSFLPIVERELRVSARRTSTYWLRCLVALAGVVIFAGLLLNTRMFPSPVVMGKNLFSSLSVLTLIYCLIEGVRETADCLSEEKREGTLGLLFLTDLKGYDVVFGKLAATGFHSFYGLLATIPILSIPLLAGGVTGGEFWRMSLVLANSLFFGLSVGMRVSAISRNEYKAFWGAIYTLSWVAMWLALSTKSLKHVIVKTVLYVIVLPWIVLGFFVTPFLMSRLGWTSLLLTPVVLLVKDFLFTGWAKRKLNEEFRTAASQLYDWAQGPVNWLDKFRRQSVNPAPPVSPMT